MILENNYKTMGLADCSDNLVLPSVERAEFDAALDRDSCVTH